MTSRGLRRTLIDFRRHPWLHLLSTATIMVALTILGVLFLCYRNFEILAQKTNPNITGTVYLREGLSDSQIQKLREKLLSLDHVQKAEFKTKKSVMAEMQSFLGGVTNEAISGVDIFPDVLELDLQPETDARTVSALKVMISRISEVTEVDFSEDWLAQYRRIRHFLKIFGFILMGGILVGCGFIIANFMGLRHQSRRNEIDVVRLIGGEREFILTPLLWEGLFEGALGSVGALAFLFFLKWLSSAVLTVQWSAILGMNDVLYLSLEQWLSLVVIGLGIAFFGSVTVFFRFQENKYQ